MGRINLALIDNNIRYLENLSGFIMEKYNHRFKLHTFSDIDTFIRYFDGEKPSPEIAVVSNVLYSARLKSLDIGMILVIRDGHGVSYGEQHSGNFDCSLDSGSRLSSSCVGVNGCGGGNSFGGVNYDGAMVLERYVDADSFVGSILKSYADKEGFQDESVSKGIYETKIILVMSPSGGTGRTSVSLGLCPLFSRMVPSVLYLNLDRASFDNPKSDSTNSSGGMSDIIFATKSRREKLPLLLEAFKREYAGGRYSYYPPPVFPMDIDELNAGEIEFLIESIRSLGLFSRVVIDTQSGLSNINKTLLELSDDIFIVVDCSPFGIKKLISLRGHMDRALMDQAKHIYKRICVLLNKANADWHSSDLESQINEQAFRSKVALLPYCEEISDIFSADLLSDVRNDFGRALAEAVKSC